MFVLIVIQLFGFVLGHLDDFCLTSLCQATSNCETSRKCRGTGSALCGPYQISKAFWKDSGSPGEEFISCAINITCSKLSVSQYMAKHGKDCDGNGLVTCKDYALILRAGPYNCHQPWVEETPFYKKFITVNHLEDSDNDIENSLYEVSHGSAMPSVANAVRPDRPSRRPNSILVPRDFPDLFYRRNSDGNPWIIEPRRSRPRTTTSRPESSTIVYEPRRRVRPNYPRVTTPRPTISTERPRTRIPGTRRRSFTSRPSTRVRPPSFRPHRTTTYAYPTTTVAPTSRRTVGTTRRVRTSTIPPTSTTYHAIWTSTTSAPPRTTHVITSTTEATTSPTKPPTSTRRSTTTRRPRTKPTFNPYFRASTTSTTFKPWFSTTESNDILPGGRNDPEGNSTTPSNVVPLSDVCLDCLCYASSGCDFESKFRCQGEGECGPYKIDYAYWYEAGFPGYEESPTEDFHRCAKDRTCSEKAVKAYLFSNMKDCNGDGFIDCIDYAAMHKGGAESCSANWVYESQFWTGFSECYGFDERLSRLVLETPNGNE